jgi:hypothetical protein
MAPFPIGTTPFLLKIDSARGSSIMPDDAADQEARQVLLNQLICGRTTSKYCTSTIKSQTSGSS